MDEEGKTTTYMKSTNMDNTNATSKISAETPKNANCAKTIFQSLLVVGQSTSKR